MSSPKYASVAIREAWEKEGKQRWDGQTHGRGLGLLIVEILGNARKSIRGRLAPSPTCEFWRNKIRGRLVGDALCNGVVVAKLNADGHPAPK